MGMSTVALKRVRKPPSMPFVHLAYCQFPVSFVQNSFDGVDLVLVQSC